MTSESGPQNTRRPWTLLLGPGPSLSQCLPVLETIAQSRAEAPAAIEQLDDWCELFACMDEVGRMLVDADLFSLEHLGLLKAFLKRFPGWDMVLLGRDPAARPLRELLRLRQIRWIPAPLDMDSMGWLMESPTQLYGNRQLPLAPRPQAAGQTSPLENAAGEGAARAADSGVIFSGGVAAGSPAASEAPAGNIPPGYVTRSSGPFGAWNDAPAQAAPPAKPQGPEADRNALALYDIPRAEPGSEAPAHERAGSASDRRDSTQSARASNGDRADKPLNQDTERQLLEEVERILVGSSNASSGVALAVAPAKTSEARSTQGETSSALANTQSEPQTLEQPELDLDEASALFEPSHAAATEQQAAKLTHLQACDGTLSETALPETALSEADLAEVQIDLDVSSEVEEQLHARARVSNPVAPAPFFKHQVADLADIVQCVDMGLDQAAVDVLNAEGAAGDRLATRFEQLCGEVARLRQYTRTLSFMASPPKAGEQRFDLAPMLEEMLTMRRSSEDAPRYLIRTPDPLPLRSDKLLLTQAFDALLFLCHACSGPEGTVRVDGRRLEGEDHGIRVSIRFPAGQLAELEPDEILQPYALRRSLPELGPNSLAAAAGIVRGQGGEVQLLKEPRGGLEWLIRLPLACTA